jgi:septal ring factor EnvC (AmiA/AmiB activator)
MTGEEMERAIEFLLQNQATLEERIDRTQAQIAETNRILQMQATSQGELNQMLTTAITNLAEAQQQLTQAQTKTEAKVDRLAGIVEKLVERLGA